MLDFDLAEMYQVTTKVLNQSVRRNIKRFPLDFMFQLTKQEVAILRSQIVTSSCGGVRERVLMLEQATGNNTEAIRTLYTAIDKLLKSPPRPQLDKDRILMGY